jgi:hypothetical protein
MNLGVCVKSNTGLMPTQLVYGRFPLPFFNLLNFTGGHMIWVLLLLVVLAGLFINSVRLTLLGILVLLIRMHPLATLSTIGAAIAWAIKQNLR